MPDYANGLSSATIGDVLSVDVDHLVAMDIQIGSWIAAFAANSKEHERRAASAGSAITDVRLLHALWALPEGIWISEDSLASDDAMVLRKVVDPLLVQKDGGAILRTYRPAGHVFAAIVSSSRAERAVGRVGRLPPIFRRLAVTHRASASIERLARQRRIGLAEGDASGLAIRVAPPQPVVGSPSVYRWWLGEVAYQSWRQSH